MYCHIDDVRNDFSLLASDFIFFIDTRLKNDEILSLKGYNFVAGVCMNNDKRVPGGVCLYAKLNQNVRLIKDINLQENSHYCKLIICSMGDFVIVGLYFSPKSLMKHRIQCLEMALKETISYECDILIGGDARGGVGGKTKHETAACVCVRQNS